jgi:hypothetical protein
MYRAHFQPMGMPRKAGKRGVSGATGTMVLEASSQISETPNSSPVTSTSKQNQEATLWVRN